MLTRVEAQTTQGVILNLPLMDPQEGYVLADIDGLDPVKATIVSSNFAQEDYSQYQNSRREPRSLIISLDLAPDYAVNAVMNLRRRLYTFFMPKSEVTLRFYTTSDLVYEITGRVEDFDAKPFAKEPKAKITMLCLNSDFVEPTLVTVPGASNVALTIPYGGSIETGFVFRMTIAEASRDTIAIQQSLGDNSTREFNIFYETLQVGDVLEISSVFRRKYVSVLKPDGTVINILYGVDPSSEWLKLWPGDNIFRVTGGPYSIEYFTHHGGL